MAPSGEGRTVPLSLRDQYPPDVNPLRREQRFPGLEGRADCVTAARPGLSSKSPSVLCGCGIGQRYGARRTHAPAWSAKPEYA